MTNTQVIQNEVLQHQTLDLAKLKTVQWVSSNYIFQQGFKTTSNQYRRMKGVTFLAYLLAPIEFVIISIYLLILQLPWPQFMLNIIFKFDLIIEDILEFISRKVEWWIDILAVRFMRLRDSFESRVDTILSLMLFACYKALDLCRWALSITFGFFLWLFFPLIWIANKILPHEKIRLDSQQNVQSGDSQERSSVSVNNQTSLDENGMNDTSNSDSEVLSASDSWDIGHVNRSGKNNNRVEMKATLEGRLRTAMYKRVKNQLTLMRKNSVCFSRGVQSYARNLFQPTTKQMFAEFIERIKTKFHLVKYWDLINKWLEPLTSHPLFIALLNLWKSLLQSVLGPKRKSKRSRSSRTESLRRANLVVAASKTNPAIGLSHSAEPVVEAKEVVHPLETFNDARAKDDVENVARDSALASSIDESSLNSDGNEGPLLVVGKKINEGKDVAKDSEEEFVKKALAEFREKKKKKSSEKQRKIVEQEIVSLSKSETSSTPKEILTKNSKPSKKKEQPPKKISFSM